MSKIEYCEYDFETCEFYANNSKFSGCILTGEKCNSQYKGFNMSEIKKYVPFVESKPYCRCQQKGTWITCTESNICAMKQEGKPKYNRLDGLTLEEIIERGAKVMFDYEASQQESTLNDTWDKISNGTRDCYLALARAFVEEFLK